MTHVSLFTGIGGLDLAAEWAGFRTILQVEREEYPLKVLAKHWPDVPRIVDVREVTSESVRESVTVVSGGFPCQPFSAAGKRQGELDDRHLWPEMLRVIQELNPTWVVGENVRGLLSISDGMVFAGILDDLGGAGYEVWPILYPAQSVGAPHQRYRIFIVAHSIGERGRGRDTKWEDAKNAWKPSGRALDGQWDVEPGVGGMVDGISQWLDEPDIPRVATGVKNRVDRLKCLGNAVVPQQAYPIFKAIAELEGA